MNHSNPSSTLGAMNVGNWELFSGLPGRGRVTRIFVRLQACGFKAILRILRILSDRAANVQT